MGPSIRSGRTRSGRGTRSPRPVLALAHVFDLFTHIFTCLRRWRFGFSHLSGSFLLLARATVHRRRAAFSLSVFPIWSGAVVPEHLRSPGGIGHIGPIAFIKTRSLLQFCLVHVQDEELLVLVHPERTPRHREQLVSHAQNSAEGQHRVAYPAGWDVDHDLVDLPKVFARRVPYAVSSQCA